MTDRFVAKAVVDKNPTAGFKLGDMLFIERIAAAVAKGNQSLAQGWSKALAETMADGSYTQLSKKILQRRRALQLSAGIRPS